MINSLRLNLAWLFKIVAKIDLCWVCNERSYTRYNWLFFNCFIKWRYQRKNLSYLFNGHLNISRYFSVIRKATSTGNAEAFKAKKIEENN